MSSISATSISGLCSGDGPAESGADPGSAFEEDAAFWSAVDFCAAMSLSSGSSAGSVVVADESRTLIGSVLGDKMFCVEIGMVSDDAVPAGSVNGDERLAARSWSGEAERA